MATRQDLTAYRAMLVDIRAKVAAGIAANRTLDQIKAAAPTAPYGMPNGFIKPDQFVEFVYKSLKEPPQKHGAETHSH